MVNGRRLSWVVGCLLPAFAYLPAAAHAQQLFQGPAQGTSDPGEQLTTTSFLAAPARPAGVYAPLPPHTVPLLPAPPGLTPPLAPIGFNEQADVAAFLTPAPGSRAPTLLSDFEGITLTNNFPPDPIIAAGPNHLMPLVNRDFAIFDKNGMNLQQIRAPAWFSNVSPGNNAFDPKVIYDHFADRWVMVWLSLDVTTETSHILVSVSDDADPNGTWCNWALPGDQNGATTVANWSDYQGLGFDESAVYVVPNQFTFSDFTFAYVKVRILPKTTLYDADCPAITFTDLWDLRDPDELDVPVFTVRPAVTFGSPGVEYLISDSRFIPGTYMTLWQITNPTTTPGLSAANVPTTARNVPPDADQLGGSTVRIDVGGPRVRNLVYRDGSVWTAHSVASASGQFARARYVRIDVTGPSVLEDVSFGSEGCWLYYPAITVGAGGHMTMVYSQSCIDEFASVRFTGRAPTDTDLQASALLKAGEANYEIAVGDPPRNRWGDYSGVAVDPSAPDRIWIFGEYAESQVANNDRWGTWIGQTDPRALGDINDDQNVDVADLTLLIDFILERQSPASPLEEQFADCNLDSGLDIGDVVCVVNVILSTPPQARLAAAIAPAPAANGRLQARLSETVDRAAGSARTVLIELDPATGVAAAHARLAYDATRTRIGIPDLAAGAEGFQLAYHDQGGGLTLVLYSLEGRELSPGAGPLVRIPIATLGTKPVDGRTLLELREMTLADRAGTVRQVAIDEVQVTALPHQFQLSEAFPNPIGPTSGARLLLDIPAAPSPALSGSAPGRGAGGSVRVQVDVYNVRGQRVRRLMDSDLSVGQHTIEWDGTNERGGHVGVGLYVIRVNAGREFSAVRKLIVSYR